VRSPINGKTIVHKEQQSGDRLNYWTEVDDKRWNTIVARGGSYKNYTIYVPGLRDPIDVSYNASASKAFTANSFKK
jgi:hypothetical protein